MYGRMDSNQVFLTECRWNFGGAEVCRFEDERYDRIWDPTTPINFTNITADYNSLSIYTVNDLPFDVISAMIEARHPLDPIILAFNNTSQIDLRNYAILYFAEAFKLQSNLNRSFDVYFNGNYNQTFSPRYKICDVIDGEVDDGIFNLTLIPSKFSNLPPIIIHKWHGAIHCEGCCGGTNVRRRFYLAGYELTGYLFNFSQMQALEIMNLADNKFEGSLPASLLNNEKLSLK
ncbi:putative leucine-rich repeat receptor-like serine/threonine-protein kinase At2g14440 [Tasmannia lanceolata]|uniref:putative leucine-rich repeat receptor-like serine/threonine-protein kinase At2g14440 n=1 Tax=Tasmannia lanceolata TaxID=3420 RepID=UPI0040634B92